MELEVVGKEKKSATRYCGLCRNKLEGRNRHASHDEEDLAILKSKHCTPTWKYLLAPTTPICCAHYEPHTHTQGKKVEKIKLKKEFCAPSLLKTVPSPEQSRRPRQTLEPPSSLEISISRKNSVKLENVDESIKRVKRSPLLVRQKQTRSMLCEDVARNYSLTLLREKDVSVEKYFDYMDSLSSAETFAYHVEEMKEVFDILRQKVQKKERFQLSSFEYHRTDLYFWTGFRNVSTIKNHFVLPLLQFYKSEENKRHLPKSRTPIEDRVLWVFIFLWTDMSWKQFFLLVSQSGSTSLKRRVLF